MIFFTIFLWTLLCQAKAWDYINIGDWGKVSSVCATGKKQSPINLYDSEDNQKPFPKHGLQLTNYSLPVEAILKNKKYTVLLSGQYYDGPRPHLSGKLLHPHSYILDTVHIHYSSSDNSAGTEHSFNGKKFAAELHLVHINKKYKDLKQAMKYKHGLLVISVMYRFDDVATPNEGMQKLSTYFESISDPFHEVKINDFDISKLLPKSRDSFYTYRGSLTTPPCTENVRWIVLKELEPINSKILLELRLITLPDAPQHNIRPLQKTGYRNVKVYN